MWKLKGYTVDAFDQTQVVYNIWANTKNDLPSTMTDIGYGIALGFGSTAQTFDDSKEWRWNGTDWVEQTDGQQIEISADDIVYDNTDSGMTATTVQDAIDEIKDLDDMQDRALAELYGEDANQQLEINYAINTGAKNLFDINTTAVQNHVTSTLADDTLTVTSNGNWAHYSVPINLTAGDYIFTTTISNFSKDSSAGATSVRIRIATSTSGGTSVVLETVTGNGPMTIPFTSPGGQLYVQFYSNYSSTTTFVSTFTASNVMIRDSVVKSATYEPYAPTNRELYDTKLDKESGRTRDINTTIQTGIYRYYGTNSTTGLPSDVTGTAPFGMLQVLANNVYITQLLYSFASGTPTPAPDFYIRRSADSGTNWTPWLKVSGTEVASASVQSLNSTLTLNLNRNDLNESLDSNFDLIDSIPEEEEGELE